MAFSLNEIWGNGFSVGSPQLGTRQLSAGAMYVCDTDSPWIMFDYTVLGGNLSSDRYTYFGIWSSAVGSTKPTTFESFYAPILSLGLHRTTRISVSGSGMRRVWIVAGGNDALKQACVQAVFRAPGTSIRVAQTGHAVGNEGWGGIKMTDLGYHSVGGVLQGGSDATLRAQHVARVAAMNPVAIIGLTLFTNDYVAGVASTDASVALDAWITDMLTLVPSANLYGITMLRWIAAEAAPAYTAIRAAEVTTYTARSIAYVDGKTLGAQALSDADMSSDPHPRISGHAKIANASYSWLTAQGITGNVIIVGNSISNGSGWEADGTTRLVAARDGCVQVLRGLR